MLLLMEPLRLHFGISHSLLWQVELAHIELPRSTMNLAHQPVLFLWSYQVSALLNTEQNPVNVMCSWGQWGQDAFLSVFTQMKQLDF